MIFRKKDFTAKRQNICDEKEFLQISPLTLGLNQTFKPHIHKWNYTKINKRIAKESWIVIRGKVKAFYYDLDQKFLCSKIINEGDITVTFRGGHNYKSLSKKILSIYESEDLRIKLSNNAKIFANEHYNYQKHFTKLTDIIQRL